MTFLVVPFGSWHSIGLIGCVSFLGKLVTFIITSIALPFKQIPSCSISFLQLRAFRNEAK